MLSYILLLDLTFKRLVHKRYSYRIVVTQVLQQKKMFSLDAPKIYYPSLVRKRVYTIFNLILIGKFV